MLLLEHCAVVLDGQSESDMHSTHRPEGPGDWHTGVDDRCAQWVELVQAVHVLLLEHCACEAVGQSVSVTHSTQTPEDVLHTRVDVKCAQCVESVQATQVPVVEH